MLLVVFPLFLGKLICYTNNRVVLLTPRKITLTVHGKIRVNSQINKIDVKFNSICSVLVIILYILLWHTQIPRIPNLYILHYNMVVHYKEEWENFSLEKQNSLNETSPPQQSLTAFYSTATYYLKLVSSIQRQWT